METPDMSDNSSIFSGIEAHDRSHWQQSHQAPVFVGSVTLVARDLKNLTQFYQHAMGLDVI